MNVLLHVPHSSPHIPSEARKDIALDDADLTREVAAITDWLTAPLGLAAIAAAGTPTQTWINPLSRLVIDPERFPDDREEMLAVGMGAVYTRTHEGSILREPDSTRDVQLLETHFQPYAAGLASAAQGSTCLLDLHSFPTAPLPYELVIHGDRPRPALCIGTDPFHTPDWLVDTLRRAWAEHVGGEVLVDTPFAGTYVPLDRYGTDPTLLSVMVEIRRDQIHPDFDEPQRLLSSGLLPPRPWEQHGPQNAFVEVNPRVVAFLAQVLSEVTAHGH